MLKDKVCRIQIKRNTAFTSTFLRAYMADGHDTLVKAYKAAGYKNNFSNIYYKYIKQHNNNSNLKSSNNCLTAT